MTNKLYTTEEMLVRGKNISLSATEHDKMKSELLSFANYHGIKPPVQKKQTWTSFYWFKTFVTSSFAVVLFIGTVYASNDSLPGEVLYSVKVDIAEEMIAVTKVTPEKKLQYQHERFEKRLNELRLMQDMTIEANAITDFQNELNELALETALIVEGEDGIENIVTLNLMSEIIAVTGAVESIIRTNANQQVADEFELIVEDMELVREEEVEDLVGTSTSTVEEYIQSQISEVSKDLVDANTITSSTVDRIKVQISNAQSSLETDEYKDAIISIYNAQTALDEEIDIVDGDNALEMEI